MPDRDSSRAWYHGSQQELTRLRSGSSITQRRDVAKAFSHRPSLLSMSDESLKHDGATPGYLHVVAEEIAPDDVHPHPHPVNAARWEWLTRRDLKLELIERTEPTAEESLTDEGDRGVEAEAGGEGRGVVRGRISEGGFTMRSLVFVSMSVLLCMGCSHSRFVLHDPAPGGSARDSPRVEIRSKDRLSILFRADGETHGIDTVKAVAAEGQHLLLSSEEWKTVRQIPRRYLSMSGLRVRSPNSDHDRPTVALPLASIEEIRVEQRDLRWPSILERMGQVPGWFLEGVVGGLTVAGSLVMYERLKRDREPDPGWQERWDSDDQKFLLALSAVGGVGGAVLYPVGRLFWPESRVKYRSYRNRGEGFRLELRD